MHECQQPVNITMKSTSTSISLKMEDVLIKLGCRHIAKLRLYVYIYIYIYPLSQQSAFVGWWNVLMSLELYEFAPPVRPYV